LLEHPDAHLVEVGPGGVLHNMLARAWRDTPRARTDAPQGEDPRDWFARTVEALRAAAASRARSSRACPAIGCRLATYECSLGGARV
jgi:hypothetical protein